MSSSSSTSSDSNIYIATADSEDYLINPIDWNNITTHGVKDNSIPGSKIISIPVSKIVGDLPGGGSKADVDASNLSSTNITAWQEKLEIDTLDALVNTKQDKLTAGTNITITNNTISSTNTKYTAGTNISISDTNVISVSGLSKSSVGLGNVDNTSDANKPISTATQTALDALVNTKQDKLRYYTEDTNTNVYIGNYPNIPESVNVSAEKDISISSDVGKISLSSSGGGVNVYGDLKIYNTGKLYIDDANPFDSYQKKLNYYREADHIDYGSYANIAANRIEFDGDIAGTGILTAISSKPSDNKLLSEKAVATALSTKQDKLNYYSETSGDNPSATISVANIKLNGSVAEGNNTTASGESSHAEGDGTNASRWCSHAEGNGTTASGPSSHAEGGVTTASGNYSHAEGGLTTASGNYSHAEGYNTEASGQYQHVSGKWNIKDTENKYAFIIGNGTTDTNRSNAFTVDWDANLNINGNATFPYDKKIVFETAASGLTATYGTYIDMSNDGGGKLLLSSDQINIQDLSTSDATTATSDATTATPGKLLVQAGNGNKTTITADKIIIGENNWLTELGYGKLLIAGDGVEDMLSYGTISSSTLTHAIKLPKGNTADSTSFQIWVGTQAEYTALTSKDPSTMYFIVATNGTVSIKFGV